MFIVIYAINLIMLMDIVHGRNGVGQLCITPNGNQGICTPITNCNYIYRKLKRSDSYNYYWFAKQSVCGTLGNIKLVCCGNPKEKLNDCGVEVADIMSRSRIYNGNDVPFDRHLWLVKLLYKEENELLEPRCLGTLINSKFVLTAAHCISQKLYYIQISLNGQDHIKFEIEKIAVHEHFSINRKHLYDIALIKIQNSSNYEGEMKWACIPKSINPPESIVAVGVLFNETDGKPDYSIKKKANLVSVSSRDCINRYHLLTMDENLFICAFGRNTSNTCMGDSGGPVLKKQKLYWTLYAITAGGAVICTLELPSIYTRIDHFLDWIDENMLNLL